MAKSKPSIIVRFFKTVFMLVFLASIAVAASWFALQSWLMTPLPIAQEGFHYDVDVGRSLSHVSQDLASQQLLTHPRWLNWYARFYQKEKIHPGEYFLESGLTPFSLLEKLNKGDVVLHQITLLEGWNFRQIITAIAEKTEIKHLLANKTGVEQLQLLNLPISHPEGWFYPDTYTYIKGASDIEILTQAYNAMRKTVDELWAGRATNLPYKDDYQALIMASIIERETGSANEREQIAGVFVRRLQQGMKLQTDPTVIYGMGETYNGKISKNDLINATAYNTYVIDGLPPTPIATPSKASIYAALHPAQGNALYFVAKGDGTSEFSATHADHQRAVTRYQLQRRSDYRSAPK